MTEQTSRHRRSRATTPADAPPPNDASTFTTNADGDRERTISVLGIDRVVVYPKDDSTPFYKDTGEEFDETAIKAIAGLDTGAAGLDAKGMHKQNLDILFWKPEVEITEGESTRAVMNPARGFPLAFFRRPEIMNKKRPAPAGAANVPQGDGNVATVEEKAKIACWFLLTAECYAVNRDKKIVKLPAGRVIWLDVNQSFANLPARAAPDLFDGEPMSLYEVLIKPLRRKQIPAGADGLPRQAWVTDLFGGRGPVARRDGFRVYGEQQIKAVRTIVQIPEVSQIRAEDYPELAGPTLAALPEHAEDAEDA
jgi:hypothetical protein